MKNYQCRKRISLILAIKSPIRNKKYLKKTLKSRIFYKKIIFLKRVNNHWHSKILKFSRNLRKIRKLIKNEKSMFLSNKLVITRKFLNFRIFINHIKKKLKRIDKNLLKNYKAVIF